MKIWQDLVKHAIVGTQRHSQLPVLAPPDLQSRQHHWQDLSTEQQLLNALALVESYQAVGKIWAAASPAPLSAAVPETAAYCSAHISQCLHRYLHEENHALVKEALGLLSQRQQLLPPELLAAFLTWSESQRPNAAQLRAVIGNRGLWLCGLNPAWQKLPGNLATAVETTDTWLEAIGSARFALFAEALTADRHQALSQLAAQWPVNNAKDRQAFLDVLAGQPTADMLPFLQTITEDRSQGVRERTTRLLAQLQDPELTRLVQDNLLAVLEIHKPLLGHEQLRVNLPDALAEIWKKRGLQEKLEYLPVLTGSAKIGNKAGWLYQWLSLSNPLTLAEQLGLSLATLVDAALRSDFSAALLSGFDFGAALHSCAEFVPLRMPLLNTREQGFWLQHFAPSYPPACIEPVAIAHFQQLDAGQALGFIYNFTAQQDTLSEPFAEAVIDVLLAAAKATPPVFYGYERKSLAQLAFKLPLANYDHLSRRLQQDDNPQFFDLLTHFSQRQALHQEFAHE
ncbi:hypothetical protein KFZ76_18610 [Methylovulum psychrotolerans]|uniref:DUF5691 domain-containing protein n=1 Tax=Methylovulum psychrotolerans TaxID=1704499 RepID=UPI001BFF64AB|nr:DUF5691 domain-containing protein [Methylovulum psychrotolerans]MBT9099712.1 hypothetical protein [Methylovulum psychrotolerans]